MTARHRRMKWLRRHKKSSEPLLICKHCHEPIEKQKSLILAGPSTGYSHVKSGFSSCDPWPSETQAEPLIN